ncbi:MAG: response regulator [Myxococcota bacterium]
MASDEKRAEAKRAKAKLKQAREAAASVPRRQRGVLIVESDPNMQWKLARILTVNGNRVVGTSTGSGALALISEWPVDLVLVDEDLPGMNGFELARHIRQRHPEIPVVLMTDPQNTEMHVAARLAGAVACIAKPFRPENLLELFSTLQIQGLLLAPVG